MKKAMMYLLLALGITLFVMFIGGAVGGFLLWFIDGFNGGKVGVSSSISYLAGLGSGLALILCLILNFVFLKNNFASYTIGRIPKPIRWKVFLGMIIAMAGMAVLFAAMNDVAIERGWRDDFLIESYTWMQHHPVFSIFVIAIVEATGNLIIYGAVLREILDWKHRPFVVIPVYAAIMGLFSVIVTPSPFVAIGFLVAWVEGWIYEYSRSVIPVIIGDVVYWIIVLSMIGTSWGWLAFLPFVVTIPVWLYAIKALEPTKPID